MSLRLITGGNRRLNKFTSIDPHEWGSLGVPYATERFYFKELRSSIDRSDQPFYHAGFLIVNTTTWAKSSVARRRITELLKAGIIFPLDPARSHQQRYLVGCVSGSGERYADWVVSCAKLAHET